MKILEVGGCCAGVPARLADLLDTRHITFGPTGFAPAKQTVQFGEARRFEVLNRVQHLPAFLAAAESYDVLHFHYRTYLPQFLDLPFWRLRGKRVWVSFHGSDIRGRALKAANPLLRLADRIFVSTPDLLDTLPDAEWLPNPVPALDPAPLPDNEIPVVVHCPSNPALKGTAVIEQAVAWLKQQEGREFVYRRVTGCSHEETLAAMRGADIVIDQALYPRLYCMVSIEAMALGRPVLAAVDRRTLARLPPDCPVVSCGTTQETIAAALAYLLDAPGRCDLLGHQGVQYVARVHSPDAVREVLLG